MSLKYNINITFFFRKCVALISLKVPSGMLNSHLEWDSPFSLPSTISLRRLNFMPFQAPDRLEKALRGLLSPPLSSAMAESRDNVSFLFSSFVTASATGAVCWRRRRGGNKSPQYPFKSRKKKVYHSVRDWTSFFAGWCWMELIFFLWKLWEKR